MPIDWDSRRVKPKKIDWDSRKTKLDEQDYMAMATQKADVSFEKNLPSMAESSLLAQRKGATMGLNNKVAAYLASKMYKDRPYEETLGELDRREALAQETHPRTFMQSDVAGGMLTGLMSGGAGAVKAVPTMARSALEGMIEGFGRSKEKDISGLNRDALISAGVSAVVPGTIEGTKKLGSLAKGFFPGSTSSPKWLNNIIGNLSKVSGANEDTAKTYKDVLSDPKKLKDALHPPSDKIANIPKMNRDLGEAFEDIHKEVGDRYEKQVSEAFAENVNDLEGFTDVLTKSRNLVDTALDELDQYPTHYAKSTRDGLIRAKASLDLNEPRVGNLQKTIDDKKIKLQKAFDDEDIELAEKIKTDIDGDLKKVGGALHRARMKIDDEIN